MPGEDDIQYTDLLVYLTQVLLIQARGSEDEYQDNYVRTYRGPIRLLEGDDGEETDIGEIELYYVDGIRALDNGLNIVDVCDSVGQEVYEYAEAVYTDGVLDVDIVGECISNDLLALHRIYIEPEHRGHEHGLRITRKIFETIGSHCGAVVLKPAPISLTSPLGQERPSEEEYVAATKRLLDYWKPLGLRATKNPSVYSVVPA